VSSVTLPLGGLRPVLLPLLPGVLRGRPPHPLPHPSRTGFLQARAHRLPLRPRVLQPLPRLWGRL